MKTSSIFKQNLECPCCGVIEEVDVYSEYIQDHENNDSEYERQCPHCGKKYTFRTTILLETTKVNREAEYQLAIMKFLSYCAFKELAAFVIRDGDGIEARPMRPEEVICMMERFIAESPWDISYLQTLKEELYKETPEESKSKRIFNRPK